MVFELRNKIPQNSGFLYSEDVLTGTIFGNLRYFGNQHLLKHFLNESLDIYGNKLSQNDDAQYEIYFWKKYCLSDSKSYNEPDLVLFNNSCVILIECKYFSFLDENIVEENGKREYENQLIRYASVISEYYNNRSKKIIIYLTNDKKMPVDILYKTENHIKNNFNDINLYWLSWSHLHKVINSNHSYFSLGNKTLLSDLIKFLEKRNLYTFNGFSVDEVEYKKFYKKNYNFSVFSYIYDWKYIKKLHKYFNNMCLYDKYRRYYLHENYYFLCNNKLNFNWRYKNE